MWRVWPGLQWWWNPSLTTCTPIEYVQMVSLTSQLRWNKTAPHLHHSRTCLSTPCWLVWGRTAMKQSGLSHSMIPKHCLCRRFPFFQDPEKSSPPRWPFVLVTQWTWRLLSSLTSSKVYSRSNIPSGHPSHFLEFKGPFVDLESTTFSREWAGAFSPECQKS